MKLGKKQIDEIVATFVVAAVFLIGALLLGGCDGSAVAGEVPAEEAPFSVEHVVAGVYVVTDHETGCEYLWRKWGYGAGMSVRIGADGKPMCGGAE